MSACAKSGRLSNTKPSPKLLSYLSAYDPHIASLALAVRNAVLDQAPTAVESLVKGYALAIGYSFTGKPLKDGFCHVVVYAGHINLGFNRGALISDPQHLLTGSGKLIRHIRIQNETEMQRPAIRRLLQASIELVRAE